MLRVPGFRGRGRKQQRKEGLGDVRPDVFPNGNKCCRVSCHLCEKKGRLFRAIVHFWWEHSENHNINRILNILRSWERWVTKRKENTHFARIIINPVPQLSIFKGWSSLVRRIINMPLKIKRTLLLAVSGWNLRRSKSHTHPHLFCTTSKTQITKQGWKQDAKPNAGNTNGVTKSSLRTLQRFTNDFGPERNFSLGPVCNYWNGKFCSDS